MSRDGWLSSDEGWLKALENTHEAVRAYARTEFDALTRKVIHRLQRFPATGIYGGDYIFKTLWDEYCHEVQEGPHDDQIVWAWTESLRPFLNDVIERLPGHQARLLSIYAVWELEEDDDPKIVGLIHPDAMCCVLQKFLAEGAGMRSLDHLGPWRNER